MALGIGFENIPGAGLVAPLFAFELTSGGQYESESRYLAMGHVNSGAALALNTPTPVNSQIECDQLCGAGSMLSDSYRVARMNAPTQEIWIEAVAAAGTSAAWTLTVGTVPADGGYGVVEIVGEPVAITAAAGASAATVATALAAAINAYYNPLTGAALPVTATVATNVVTITARHPGLIMNTIDVFAPTTIRGNIFATMLTIAQSVTATGSPDTSAALAACGDAPFDFIVAPWSDSANMLRYKTFLSDVSGRWAYNRQIFGLIYTVATDTTSALTTLGLGENDRHIIVLPRITAGSDPSPAWAWANGIASRVTPWLSDGVTGNVSRNQTGLVVEGLKAPRDRSKWLNYPQRNTFLRSGISTWYINGDGRVAIDKLITTYQSNPLGQPDTTFRDVQSMAQAMVMLKFYRAELSSQHGQKALADDNPGGLDSISTPPDIKGTIIHSAFTLERRGVQENAREFANLVIVRRNDENNNRVDCLLPLDRVNPLDIVAANARLYSQYPRGLAA